MANKKEIKRISLLRRKKNLNEKLIDILSPEKISVKTKKGRVTKTVIRDGEQKAKQLGISVATIRRWSKYGVPERADKKKISKIEKAFEKLPKKVKRTTVTSVEFTPHNFSADALPFKKYSDKFKKTKRNEAFVFRIGADLYFSKNLLPKRAQRSWGDNTTYIVRNYSFSRIYRTFAEGEKKFLKEFREDLEGRNSLEKFVVIWFDVARHSLIKE